MDSNRRYPYRYYVGESSRRQPPTSKELREAKYKVLCPSDDILTDLRTCLTCEQWCSPLNSIGALSCRFHPLPKNGPSGGRWHGPGVFECCGVSDDPQHKLFHSRFGRKGCTAKDCCPIDKIPYPRKIEEKDWPAALREKVYEDINTINSRENQNWAEIVVHLRFKGLRIDEQDSFYLSRVDEENCKERMRHKYLKDEKLSKCLRLHSKEKEGLVRMREIIVDNRLTVGQMVERYYSPTASPRVDLQCTYEVKADDLTILSVAQRFSIDEAALRKVNHPSIEDYPAPGTRLIVPYNALTKKAVEFFCAIERPVFLKLEGVVAWTSATKNGPWTQWAPEGTNNIYYGNGLYLILGKDWTLTSADAVAWETRTAGTDGVYRVVGSIRAAFGPLTDGSVPIGSTDLCGSLKEDKDYSLEQLA